MAFTKLTTFAAGASSISTQKRALSFMKPATNDQKLPVNQFIFNADLSRKTLLFRDGDISKDQGKVLNMQP